MKKDAEILYHLKNITLKLSETNLDFTVNFHFEKNDYFDGETLFKTYIYDTDAHYPTKANSSVINWKAGKNPTKDTKILKTKSKDFNKF